MKTTGIFMATVFMVHFSTSPYEGTIESEHITTVNDVDVNVLDEERNKNREKERENT
jgi:hypothetical protein